MGRRDIPGPAWKIAGDHAQLVAAFQLDRLPACERSRPDLRAAQVLKDGDASARLVRRAADPCDHLRVRFMGAVREIEAEYVYAGGNQIPKRRVARRRGSDGSNDLRVSHKLSLQYESPCILSVCDVARDVSKPSRHYDDDQDL